MGKVFGKFADAKDGGVRHDFLSAAQDVFSTAEFPWRVCIMNLVRHIGLFRITVFILSVTCLCLRPGPLSAGEVAAMSAQESFDRGCALAEMGVFHRAVEAFSRTIELAPNFVHAYNNRGYAYSELGNYRLAIQDFNRAIGMDPNEVIFRFNRGIAFGRQEEYQLAIKDFTQVIAMDPNHAEAHFFLGLIQRASPGEGQKGADNIRVSAQMGNKTAQHYLRTRLMGWY
jgi:tetratricopeptide (TPR) repeat protein